jgi:UDP-glucose/GDP-mannose dehydrogenase family, central domain
VESGLTLVVGVGEVGDALAQVLERAHHVARLDLKPAPIDEPVEVMHICFPFASRSQFETAVRGYIRRFQPRLTIINSTVLPNTTRNLVRATGASIAFSPVRGKHSRMKQELLHYAKFIGALDDETRRMARKHFAAAGMKTRLMPAPETLELAKLAETTYFGVLIAFAQQLNRYAEEVGADYGEINRFFTEVDFLPRAAYFPGFIGGHCVVPNINLMLQIAPADLLQAVLSSNQLRALEIEDENRAAAGGSSMRMEAKNGAARGRSIESAGENGAARGSAVGDN